MRLLGSRAFSPSKERPQCEETKLERGAAWQKMEQEREDLWTSFISTRNEYYVKINREEKRKHRKGPHYITDMSIENSR